MANATAVQMAYATALGETTHASTPTPAPVAITDGHAVAV